MARRATFICGAARWLLLAGLTGCAGLQGHAREGEAAGNIIPVRAGTTVVLARHAEKQNSAANTNLDPDHNDDGVGVNRALALESIAAKAGVAAVYVTEFCRTAQTGQPTALARNIALQVERVDVPSAGIDDCDPLITARIDLLSSTVNSPAALADRILTHHAGDVVLVIGHSNTVPAIVEALGADSLCPTFFALQTNGTCHIPSGEFDNLFVVTVAPGSEAATVARQKY